jgi:hypothetical protein
MLVVSGVFMICAAISVVFVTDKGETATAELKK